jgi:hypothetical protein
MHAHGSLARVARRPRSPVRRKGDGGARWRGLESGTGTEKATLPDDEQRRP